MSSNSTESQYVLRHINGVPVWDGENLTLRDYETAALWFRAGLKPRNVLWLVCGQTCKKPAREVVRTCRHQDFEDARGVERLLRILRESPPASMPVLTPTRKYRRTTKLDEDQEKPSETIS